MMYSVSSELYTLKWPRVLRRPSGGSFSGSLTFPFGDMECRLTASVIVYRRREQAPEATGTRLRTWFPCPGGSFTPSGSDGEALNDFSFSEVRALL